MPFEKLPNPPIKGVSLVCVAYLIPATLYYSFLVMVYSDWKNRTVVAAWFVTVICFSPPLLALWRTVIAGLRSKDFPERISLSKPVRTALFVGILEVVALGAYGTSAHLLGPYTESHFAASFVALCYCPAALAAGFYLWAGRLQYLGTPQSNATLT